MTGVYQSTPPRGLSSRLPRSTSVPLKPLSEVGKPLWGQSCPTPDRWEGRRVWTVLVAHIHTGLNTGTHMVVGHVGKSGHSYPEVLRRCLAKALSLDKCRKLVLKPWAPCVPMLRKVILKYSCFFFINGNLIGEINLKLFIKCLMNFLLCGQSCLLGLNACVELKKLTNMYTSQARVPVRVVLTVASCICHNTNIFPPL